MSSRPARKSLVGPPIMCRTEPDESVSTLTSNDAARSLPVSLNVAEEYCGDGPANVGSEASLLPSRKRLMPRNSPEAIAQTARSTPTRRVARPAREGLAPDPGLAGAAAPWTTEGPVSAGGCPLGGRDGGVGRFGNSGPAPAGCALATRGAVGAGAPVAPGAAVGAGGGGATDGGAHEGATDATA